MALRGRWSFSIFSQPTATPHIQVWTLTFARVLVTIPSRTPRVLQLCSLQTPLLCLCLAKCRSLIVFISTSESSCFSFSFFSLTSSSTRQLLPHQPRFPLKLCSLSPGVSRSQCQDPQISPGTYWGVRNAENWVTTLKHHWGTVGPQTHHTVTCPCCLLILLVFSIFINLSSGSF